MCYVEIIDFCWYLVIRNYPLYYAYHFSIIKQVGLILKLAPWQDRVIFPIYPCLFLLPVDMYACSWIVFFMRIVWFVLLWHCRLNLFNIKNLCECLIKENNVYVLAVAAEGMKVVGLLGSVLLYILRELITYWSHFMTFDITKWILLASLLKIGVLQPL